MSKPGKSNRVYLEHILLEIGKISRFTSKYSREEEILFSAIVQCLSAIGEAARGFSNDFSQRHAEVPWHAIIAFRNILVHEYFGINEQRVWKVVYEEIPRLKIQIQKILEQES